jgi:hypothetical protein
MAIHFSSALPEQNLTAVWQVIPQNISKTKSKQFPIFCAERLILTHPHGARQKFLFSGNSTPGQASDL